MLKQISFVLLILMVLKFPVSAGSMSLQVSHGAVSPGEVVDISISIAGNPGTIAYQMDILYDDTMLVPLEVIKVNGTQPLVSNTIITDGGGHCIRLAYADTVSSTYNGILFTIRFQADEKLIPGQQTDIQVNNCQFFGSEGGLIPIEIINGSVEVQASQSNQSNGSDALSVDPVSGASGGSQVGSESREPSDIQSMSAVDTDSGQPNRSVISESDDKNPDPSRRQWVLFSILLIAMSAVLTTMIRKKIRSTGSRPQ